MNCGILSRNCAPTESSSERHDDRQAAEEPFFPRFSQPDQNNSVLHRENTKLPNPDKRQRLINPQRQPFRDTCCLSFCVFVLSGFRDCRMTMLNSQELGQSRKNRQDSDWPNIQATTSHSERSEESHLSFAEQKRSFLSFRMQDKTHVLLILLILSTLPSCFLQRNSIGRVLIPNLVLATILAWRNAGQATKDRRK